MPWFVIGTTASVAIKAETEEDAIEKAWRSSDWEIHDDEVNVVDVFPDDYWRDPPAPP